MLRSMLQGVLGSILVWSLLAGCSGYDWPTWGGRVVEVYFVTEDVSLVVGESMQLDWNVITTGIRFDGVTWASSDSSVATVSSSGFLTAVAEGECEVEVMSSSDPTKYDRITVTVLSEGTSNVQER